jgi:hypothetical protein
MKLEAVIASHAGNKFLTLAGGVSDLWFQAGLLWIVGLMLGLGEIPMHLRMTATPAGVVTFLKASSRPSSSCLVLSNGGNPRTSGSGCSGTTVSFPP